MVLASVIAGASGGALANVALSPLGGGAGMLQSYWYGAGLILGERDMYTFHWEKIKQRLEGGEDYLSVLEGEMTPAITAIANFSLKIMKDTSQIYLTAGVDMLAKLVENMLMLLAGEKPNEMQCPPGFKWDSVMNQCRPTTVEQPPPPPPTPPADEGETVDGVTLPPVQVDPGSYIMTWTSYDNAAAKIIDTVTKTFNEGDLISLAVIFLRDMLAMQHETLTGGNFNPGSLRTRVEFINLLVQKYPAVYQKVHDTVIG